MGQHRGAAADGVPTEGLVRSNKEMMTAKASHRSSIQLDATTDMEQAVDFCSQFQFMENQDTS